MKERKEGRESGEKEREREEAEAGRRRKLGTDENLLSTLMEDVVITLDLCCCL